MEDEEWQLQERHLQTMRDNLEMLFEHSFETVIVEEEGSPGGDKTTRTELRANTPIIKEYIRQNVAFSKLLQKQDK